MEAPIHVSNVMFVDPEGKAPRTGWAENGERYATLKVVTKHNSVILRKGGSCMNRLNAKIQKRSSTTLKNLTTNQLWKYQK